jgi:5-methyltetrahydrofolate--homocysteine methyltransferase
MDLSEEVDFKALSDEELLEQMGDDLYDGLSDQVVEATEEALSRGISPHRILNEGLVAGMEIVGEDFRDGILFVPEVMMAANAMKAAMELLRPLLTQTNAPKAGTMVIGTVKGDIHDIGKNLVAMMMEGAGFQVINLGINTPAEKFLQAVREHDADILGMSAMLTTTMPYMQVVIRKLVEEGMRDDVIVMVGGAPLNEAFAQEIEADAYARDAGTAVQVAKDLIARRKAA